MLLTLGIASAFSLLEAFNTVLYDRVPWCNLHKSATTAMVCTGGFLVGLLMTTNGGSHVLDVFDHYLSDFLLVIIGMTECIFVGWTYDMDRLAREIEEHQRPPRVFQFMVRYVTPAVVGVLGVFNLVREFVTPSATTRGGRTSWVGCSSSSSACSRSACSSLSRPRARGRLAVRWARAR